ncbi:MAG TPA: flagellar biosynthesis protein FliQ [Casimicrobiaceae bacterium]|jgi:flagellar biosynthetic protein FliQ|nr:flagellar biosynthesis protein FliQ [Casimicrobiaceae bacterium]
MNSETVLTLGAGALQLTMLLAAPLLVTALVVGLVVSVFQAATQINEMTLSFIPKLVAMFVVLVVAGPWMLALLVDYMQRLFSSIPQMIG